MAKKEETKTVIDTENTETKEDKKLLLDALNRRLGDLLLEMAIFPYTESNLLRLKLSNPNASAKIDTVLANMETTKEETFKQISFLKEKKKEIQGNKK